MTITFKAAGVNSESSTTSIAVSVPAIAVNDCGLIWLYLQTNASITAPADWTEVGSHLSAGAGTLRLFKSKTPAAARNVNFTAPAAGMWATSAVYQGDNVDVSGTPYDSHNSSASSAQSAALTFTSSTFFAWYGVIYAARTYSAMLTSGTISATQSIRSYLTIPIASMRQYVADAVIASASGGRLLADFSGSNTTSSTRGVVLIELGSGEPEPELDTTPPSVSLTSPSDGSAQNGSVTVSGTAADNVGVSKVEIWINGSYLTDASYSAGSFTYTLDTTVLPNGSNTIQAKAYDAALNSTSTSIRTIEVFNETPAEATFVAAGTPIESIEANGTSLGLRIPAHQQNDVAVAVIGYFSSGAVTPPSGWIEIGTQVQENLIYYRTFRSLLPTTELSETTVNFTVPAASMGTGTSRSVVFRGSSAAGIAVSFYDHNTTSMTGYITPVITSPGMYAVFAFAYGAPSSVGTFAVLSGTATFEGIQRDFSPYLTGMYRQVVSTLKVTAVNSAIIEGDWSTGAGSNTFMFYIPGGVSVEPEEPEDPPTPFYVQSGFGPIDKLAYQGIDLDRVYRGDILIWSVNDGEDFVWSGSGVPRQSSMPSMAEAWTLATPPTASRSSSATLGTTLIPITDPGNVMVGGAKNLSLVEVSSGYYRPPFVADTGSASNSNPRQVAPWGFRRRTNATQIEIAIRGRTDLVAVGNTSLRQPIRVKVDGKWTHDYAYLTNAGGIGMEANPWVLTQGSTTFVKLTFPTAVMRDIQIEMLCEIAGFRVNSGATFETTPPIKNTIAIIGESLSSGLNHMTGEFSHTSPQGDQAYATYTGVTSYFGFIMQSLGYDDGFNAGSSGSGFARNGDTVPFANTQRLAEVVAKDPKCIIVGSPGNDGNNSVTGATVSSAANTVLSNLRSALPDAIIVLLGLGNYAGGNWIDIDNAIRARAQQYGAWYIQPYASGEVVNPSGAVVATLTPINLLTYESSDGLHPSQEGSMIIGKTVAQFVKACHPA